MHRAPHASLLNINYQVRLRRDFIRIIHTSEPLDLPIPRLRIDASLIRLLGMLKRCGNMDELKITILLN